MTMMKKSEAPVRSLLSLDDSAVLRAVSCVTAPCSELPELQDTNRTGPHTAQHRAGEHSPSRKRTSAHSTPQASRQSDQQCNAPAREHAVGANEVAVARRVGRRDDGRADVDVLVLLALLADVVHAEAGPEQLANAATRRV